MIHVGDNTWNLRIFITDLQVEKTLRVRSDLHVGGVMLKLVDPGTYGWVHRSITCGKAGFATEASWKVRK